LSNASMESLSEQVASKLFDVDSLASGRIQKLVCRIETLQNDLTAELELTERRITKMCS